MHGGPDDVLGAGPPFGGQRAGPGRGIATGVRQVAGHERGPEQAGLGLGEAHVTENERAQPGTGSPLVVPAGIPHAAANAKAA
ncbi:hypothetical protein [Streptomyces sp. NPDC058665]|uniref:hypothetical protein n=1 Tax=Streptomyces sp. NPDC058665 TaxID=3346586 RepID=UPI00364AD4B2